MPVTQEALEEMYRKRCGKSGSERERIKSPPSYVVVRVGKVSVPDFNVKGGVIMVIEMEGEALVESRIQSF